MTPDELMLQRVRNNNNAAARQRPPKTTGERVARDAKSVATGLRQTAEGTVGMGGDLPGYGRGAAEYLTDKASQLPFVGDLVTPGAKETAGNMGEALGTAMSPMGKIIAGLKMLGIDIGDEAEQTINPGSQDVHGAVSDVLPEPVEKATTYEPVNTEEKLFNFAGGLLPSIFTGGAEIQAAKGGADLLGALVKRLGTRVAAPAATMTASTAATDKAVEAGVISPEDAMAINTVIGAVSSGGFAKLEGPSRAKAAVAGIADNPEAVRILSEALKAEGLDDAAVMSNLQKMGPEGKLVDLGPAVRQKGVEAVSAPTEGRLIMRKALEERQGRSGPRLTNLREDALGPGGNKPEVMGEIKKELSDIGEGYDTAHPQQVRPANTQHIIDEIDTELGSVKDEGLRKILNDIKGNLHIKDRFGTATPNLDPSSSGLQGAREAIDLKTQTVKGKNLNLSPQEDRLYTKYRKLIDQELGGANPAVKAVDVDYRAKSGERKAFDFGEQSLSKGGKVQTNPEFDAAWKNLTPEQQQRALQGASRYVEVRMGLNPDDRGALNSLFGGDINEGKLRTMIGDEKTNAFMEGLANEDAFDLSHKQIVKNAGAPGAAQPEENISKGSVQTGVITGLATGSPAVGVTAGAVNTAKNWLRNKLAGTMSDAVKSDMAKLLVSDSPEDVLKAAALLRKADKTSAMPQAMLGALVARQSGGPR